MYGIAGNLRHSQSLADLTSDRTPHHADHDVLARSGSSGMLLDIPGRNHHSGGQKRLSAPDIAFGAAQITRPEQSELARLARPGDYGSNPHLTGSHRDLSTVGVKGRLADYRPTDRRESHEDPVPPEDYEFNSPTRPSTDGFYDTNGHVGKRLSSNTPSSNLHVGASKTASTHSSISSGMESIAGRFEESPEFYAAPLSHERPRSSSLYDILSPSIDMTSSRRCSDDLGVRGKQQQIQQQQHENQSSSRSPSGPPSLSELVSGRHNLRQAGGSRTLADSPSHCAGNRDPAVAGGDSLAGTIRDTGFSPVVFSPHKAPQSASSSERSSSEAVPVATPGRPPLPPPRHGRFDSRKRHSEPNILDGSPQNDPNRDQRREFTHSELYRRRMPAESITESPQSHDTGASSDSDSPQTFQTLSSRGEGAGESDLPVSRKSSLASTVGPWVGPGDRSLSGAPSLRRMAVEASAANRGHDSGGPTYPYGPTSQNDKLGHGADREPGAGSLAVHSAVAVPTINVTDIEGPLNSPEGDYPHNDFLPPASHSHPVLDPGPRPEPLSGRSSVSNIYKSISDVSAHCKPGWAQMDETGSTNADSGVDDEGAEDGVNGTWRPYDAFQMSEREVEDEDKVFRQILKVLRLVLYLFIFCAVLGGAVASRLSLFLLASGVSQDETSRGVSVVMLMFCICTPLAFSWVFSFVKILFSDKQWPSFPTFLFLLTVEMLQTFGVSLLLFKILPVTDFFRGITVTMAAFQIPALLKLILAKRKLGLHCWDIVKLLATILAFATQIAAIVFFLVTPFSGDGVKETIPKGKEPKQAPKLSALVWELPLALILTSLGWWENYVSGEWSLCGKVTFSFKRARKVVQEVRDTGNFLVAPFKVGLTVLLAKYLTGATFQLPKRARTDRSDFHLDNYSLLYLQILSSVLVTYLASLACKLHMQKTAFAFPLLLSPLASLALVYCQCRYEFLPGDWHTGVWLCPAWSWQLGGEARTERGEMMLLMLCAAGLWVSYSLVVSHVWFPKSERMAKVEKLFVTPHLDTVFPDYHLTLRRRRNDHELRATRLEQFTYVGDQVEADRAVELSDVTPMVYVCATMWHETRREMTQLLKSLFRLDYVHCASKLAQDKFQIKDPDYYNLEIHIIFDDAFELDDEGEKSVPNIFVKQLIECMEEAARSVIKGPIDIPPPVKTPTPYGGKLIWTMPGMTKMHVHIKNKDLIRHRKRWSQCMYLYYLLGFRLLGTKDDAHSDTQSEGDGDHQYANVRHRGDKAKAKAKESGVKVKSKVKAKRRKLAAMPLRSLLGHMQPEKYEKTVQMSENTFIMTLDGDVDFKPDSVRLLLDRMKKNKKVGAVCGRIHPIGSGPMVWYQQFEYAVGHWLQKASEHVFGCVLCCPGCFSLFRGSALMDDNVMKKYTTKPTEAAHYIQFEQGEDRWLCTLLLQQGHRIDYCAGADALTYAPETFNEFFNQRRRWSPSTLANMMDLLSSWRETVRINDNISRLYILYQFMLMAASILAPSTVILMITGSYHSVLGISILWSFVMSLTPVLFYLLICLTQKNDLQIKVGAVLTALYTVVMMIATVGTMISVATESFNSPNVVFLCGLFIIFIIASLLHPQEFFCLVYGALYFMVVPSTFILLTVYYLCNLNNVSWGTREMPKKLTPQEEEAAKKAEEERSKKKKRSAFSLYGAVALVRELKDAVKGLWGLRDELQQQVKQSRQASLDHQLQQGPVADVELGIPQQTIAIVQPPARPHPPGYEPNSDAPHWLNLGYLGYGIVQPLSQEEKEFWMYLIRKYLHPLEEDKAQKAKIAEDLGIIRNNVVFIYVMMNFLWCVIALQLQAMEGTLKSTFYLVEKYEPLSLAFLAVFATVLLLQFLSMLVHRWGTFLHLMASTRIDWCCGQGHSEEDFARYVVAQTKRLQNPEPSPDYDNDGNDDDDDDDEGDDDDVGFGSFEDGMSLSDFDRSLRDLPVLGEEKNSGCGAEKEPGGGTGSGSGSGHHGAIYETLGRHNNRARFPASSDRYNQQRPRVYGQQRPRVYGQQPHQPQHHVQPHLFRSTSTRGQFPMLKTIFEQNLTHLQQRYQNMQQQQQQHRGAPVVPSPGGPARGGMSTVRQPSWPRRYVPWGGDRQGDMRQRFFTHHFQAGVTTQQPPLGTPQGQGRLFRTDAAHVV